MTIKTMEVYLCDFEECGATHRFGMLPEGWIWAAWRRDIATGNEQQPTMKKMTEHHFCCDAHLKAWKKANGAQDREVQSSIDKVKVNV